MKGITLSKKYFYEECLEKIQSELVDIYPYMAIGLVGEGSECFGLDDKISQDHDFGPGFCIWIPLEKYLTCNKRIENFLGKIKKEYQGFKRIKSDGSDKRIGLFSIEEFYLKYINNYQFPMSNKTWLKIPESYLATCTNGEVFIDNYGEFTKVREYLKNFYPEDVLKKKLSAYLAKMAQSGQYNIDRCLRREDWTAYYFSKYEFCNATYGALFLLAHEYKPYYKLTGRYLKKIDYYPVALFDDLHQVQYSTFENIQKQINRICLFIYEIVRQRYNLATNSTFLIDIAKELQNSIEDFEIKSMHLMKGNEYA